MWINLGKCFNLIRDSLFLQQFANGYIETLKFQTFGKFYNSSRIVAFPTLARAFGEDYTGQVQLKEYKTRLNDVT